jgi:hypothetical protein
VVERRFIEHRDTEVLLVSIRFGHLEERVDLSHRRDVVWDEGLDPGLKIDLLGLIPRDVLKELFDLRLNREVGVLNRVVRAWYIFIIIVVVILLDLLLWLLLGC